jgi:hypothetical protein
VQRGHDDESDAQGDAVRGDARPLAEADQIRLDEASDGGLADPAKRQRRQGDAQLVGGEVLVQAR